MLRIIFLQVFITLVLLPATLIRADEKIKIGIATVLSGDYAVLGQNIVRTVDAYNKIYPNNKFEIIFEDARINSVDGLKAYQSLITKGAQIIIAACSSNATIAAAGILNKHKTPTISVATGGKNIDNAGEYIFRIGNSDVLNGIQQAQYFLDYNLLKIALLTEQTEYTQDIAETFSKDFLSRGGKLVFNEEFAPGTQDFKSLAMKIKSAKPDALFIPTQTGTALGIFLKQWDQVTLKEKEVKVFTTFVAASNEDAHAIAGNLMKGVFYMNPSYKKNNFELQKLFSAYKNLYQVEPAIPFHSAGLADAFNLITQYQNKISIFDAQKFREFMLSIKNYEGMLGNLTFDSKGNTSVGFEIAEIK